MLNLTPLARPFILPRAMQMDTWQGRVEQIQLEQLSSLTRRAANTAFGRQHNLANIKTHEQLAERVPVNHYEDLKPFIMRMLHGEPDILWPGKVRNFAQSSGTSDGKSKYIPITPQGLRQNHLAGAAMALSCYMRRNPRSRIFSGRSFILGGSYANTLPFAPPAGIRVGDLSATLISKVPRIIEMFYRVPSRRIALMADWNEKLPALIEASSRQNVTNISGVPSWFMAVLDGILDYTGKKSIREVWPNLEVFFHGGINFEPYREQYRRLMGGEQTDIHYVETYNASEGFFAVQDLPDNRAMRLLLQQGVFYEFLQPGQSSPVMAHQVKKGLVYELLITTCNGLWRYSTGDTVKIESVDPLRITIAGRTKHFINAFGEEVMVYNADAALLKACSQTGAHVVNYTAAPLYAHDRQKGRHQWLIEFSTPPANIESFAKLLDEALRQENSDYDAKRTHSLFLDSALVQPVPKGTFDRWLASTGKLGGQRKIPRLSNDRHIVDAILRFLN